MLLGRTPVGERIVDHLARDVGLHEPVREARGKDPADAIAQAPSGVGVLHGQTQEKGENVRRGDLVDPAITESRKDVVLERLPPSSRVRGGPPAAMGLQETLGGDAKRRHSDAAFLGKGVTARADQPTVVHRALTGVCEAHDRPSPETELAAPTVDGEALHPGLRAPGGHIEIQRPSVGIPSGLGQSPDLRSRELAHDRAPGAETRGVTGNACDEGGPAKPDDETHSSISWATQRAARTPSETGAGNRAKGMSG